MSNFFREMRLVIALQVDLDLLFNIVKYDNVDKSKIECFSCNLAIPFLELGENKEQRMEEIIKTGIHVLAEKLYHVLHL